MTQEILKAIKEKFPDDEFQLCEGQIPAPAKDEPGHAGDTYIVIPAARIKDVCELMKVMDSFDFDCLSDQTAIDRKESFEVVYNLFSYKHGHSIAFKVVLTHEGTPKVPTVEAVWPIANWFEREIYDLFGIVFDGHSDMRRIMMPDDWPGHPLRKDYKEAEDYHGISTTRTSLLQ